MTGILLFLPTLYGVPHILYMTNFLYIVIKKRGKLSVNNVFYFLSFIVVLTLLNRMVHITKANNMEEIIPYTVMMIVAFIISLEISTKDLLAIITLIVLEAFSGILELISGTNSFLPVDEIELYQDYLYNYRVYGLSSNSSVFALKMFIGILLLDYLVDVGRAKKTKLIIACKMIMIIGMFASFNRTVIFVVTVYYLVRLVFTTDYSKKVNRYILISLVGLLIVLGISFKNSIILELTRGTGNVYISGRDQIWQEGLLFIKNNLLFGNGSYKFYVEYHDTLQHLHNSFLQILANNGLIITLLVICMIVLKLQRKNFIYIAAIMFYSMFQYGIFWGISLLDVILCYFLFNRNAFSRGENVNIQQATVIANLEKGCS